MFFTLYEIFTLSFKFNEVVSGVMNSKVDEFLSCLNNEIENKTDKYWLEQVVFEIGDDQNLNIVVNSEFIKNSIEKKVLNTIKRVYKNINKFGDCVFVLDKTLSIPTNEFEIVEEVEVVEDTPVQNQTSYELGVFDELFVGSCNNLAITAAKNVVTSPGKRFNPLFVYGKPGVGKTHLLKTIERSSVSSFYIDSESFLESYINGIKNKDIDVFKNKIRSVDILLIDDIQFFLGKKGVSEELFHTINYFLNNSKAVVLASDQKPQELIGFPERLVSRILNGLVTDIEKPDQKMFSEVLNRNNVEYGGNLITKKEFDLLTSLEFQSFREINGVVNNLIINKQTGTGNSSYVAELVSMYSNNKVLELTPEFILDYCSDLYQVDKRLVLSKNRSEQVSNARHLFIYLMRKHTEYSLNPVSYTHLRAHETR